MSNSQKTRVIAFAGLFTAVIAVATAYIHIPTGLGYTHAGDGFIFLAASLLPFPYGIAAAAIGASLADVICGMAIWAPATLIIKLLMALSFTSKQDKILVRRNFLALIPALALNIVGYSLYEAFVMTEGSLGAALGTAFGQTPFYTIQTLIGAVIFSTLGKALDRTGAARRTIKA